MELKGFEAYLKRARRTVAEAASLMIPHVVDHLEQAIRASTEAERHQESHPERWDDRPYIPEHLADPTV